MLTMRIVCLSAISTSQLMQRAKMSNTPKVTEQERFNLYLEAEKRKGLVDIKLYPERISIASTEDFYAELNDMNYAYQADSFEKITDL